MGRPADPAANAEYPSVVWRWTTSRKKTPPSAA